MSLHFYLFHNYQTNDFNWDEFITVFSLFDNTTIYFCKHAKFTMQQILLQIHQFSVFLQIKKTLKLVQ